MEECDPSVHRLPEESGGEHPGLSPAGRSSRAALTPMPNGVITGQRVRGLHRVGVYVPGGTAGYPSSVLMNVIPAQVAGVEEIVMATPPGRTGKPDPNILAAAYVAGVDRVFLMGGAQAVAALALRHRERAPRWTRLWARATSLWPRPKSSCTAWWTST